MSERVYSGEKLAFGGRLSDQISLNIPQLKTTEGFDCLSVFFLIFLILLFLVDIVFFISNMKRRKVITTLQDSLHRHKEISASRNLMWY